MLHNNTITRISLLLGTCILSQCNSFKTDCAAIAEREQLIAQEPAGDYYVGRRYYIPSTRFWGYLRRPGQSWRSAQLVVMDESQTLTPDRGLEPPLANATFGTDANVEYYIRGSYSGEKAYEPNSNQILPIFTASNYQIKDSKPGFLFRPSEHYTPSMLTLFPKIMPNPQDCAKIKQQ